MSTILVPPFSKSLQFGSQTESLTTIPTYPHIPLDPNTTSSYIQREVSVSRLNVIYGHLWLAGRKFHIRPLHKQLMLQRKILITEDPSMHLIWFENTIFLKPVPEALLSFEFWERCICVSSLGDERPTHRSHLYEPACSFLLSYTNLIVHPSDYRIAVSHHLIPDMGFSIWMLLAQDVRTTCSQSAFIPSPRWEYGELRLSRLNWIYKLTFRGYAYFYVFTEYSPYFGKNFQLLLLGFAYYSVALAAMQVLVSSKDPEGWLVSWCVKFSAVIILFVFICVLGILGLFLGLFLYHLVLTLIHQRKYRGKSRIA